jgi:hypothetical protein
MELEITPEFADAFMKRVCDVHNTAIDKESCLQQSSFYKYEIILQQCEKAKTQLITAGAEE